MNNETEIAKKVSIKIRLLRGNETQKEFAQKLGVSPQAVSDWENANKIPRMGIIEKLSIIYNVPKSFILGEADNISENNIEIVDNRLEEIIERIKTRRLELDMSYQDLADKTGMSKSTLQRYETGTIGNVGLDKLEILSKALQIDPAYLMGWTDNPGTDGTVYFPRISKKTGHFTDRKPREEVERLYRHIEELPSEAIKEAENYLEFLKNKYKE